MNVNMRIVETMRIGIRMRTTLTRRSVHVDTIGSTLDLPVLECSTMFMYDIWWIAYFSRLLCVHYHLKYNHQPCEYQIFIPRMNI